jgi:tetratricopeptide (TPR) repeat protein
MNLWDPTFKPGLRLSNLVAEMIFSGRKAEAVACGIAAMTLEPERLETYANLAGAYEQIRGCEEFQIATARAGLNLDRLRAVNVGDRFAHSRDKRNEQEDLMRSDLFHNMSLAQNRLYQWNAALESCNQAHRLNPGNPWNLGLAAQLMEQMGDPAAGAQMNTGAIALLEDPECPYNNGTPAAVRLLRESYLGRAICHLQAGNMPGYFADFERRLGFGDPEKNLACKLYQQGQLWRPGDPIEDHVVVILEQGLGDQIQFARLARRFAEANHLKSLRFVADPIIEALIRPLEIGRPTLAEGVLSYVASFDLIRWAYERGLPHPFGKWEGPYIKAPGKAEIARKEGRTKGTQKTVIGFCWQGNPMHVYDWARSMPFKAFLEWAEPRQESCTFVSLQHGEKLFKMPEWMIDGDRPDFAGLSEVIAACDVIVGPDTGVMHLAGAMGKPAVMLHTFHREWRWRLSTQLYAKSFRQLQQFKAGDWKELLSRLGPELDSLLSAVEQTDLSTAMAQH